jgi:hypothetical protein
VVCCRLFLCRSSGTLWLGSARFPCRRLRSALQSFSAGPLSQAIAGWRFQVVASSLLSMAAAASPLSQAIARSSPGRLLEPCSSGHYHKLAFPGDCLSPAFRATVSSHSRAIASGLLARLTFLQAVLAALPALPG